MQFAAISMKGDLHDPNTIMHLTDLILASISMTKAPGAVVCTYPFENKGGVGYTYFQPMTESFITWDIYPELNGGYLFIASCKTFRLMDIIIVLKSNRLKIVECPTLQISLDSV